MAGPCELRIRLSIRGRVLRDYVFNQEEIAIGRDPSGDIVLDNAGISRNHSRITRSPSGWEIFDEGSVNGTWLNDQRVRRGPLVDGDTVRIGKFSLSVQTSSARAGAAFLEPEFSLGSPAPDRMREADGTTVLTRGQLARVLSAVRETEEEVEPALPRQCLPWERPEASGRFPGVLVLILGALLGVITGGLAVYLITR